MGPFEAFNALGGQVRVSLTESCNLKCWFCHNEGATPPHSEAAPKSSYLDPEHAIAVIDTAISLGADRIYITGGEPLLHPRARDILESIPEHTSDQYSVTLITNATLLSRSLPWLRHCHIDKYKLSIHYFSDETFAEIADTKLPVRRITEPIRVAASTLPNIELNTLIQDQNMTEIPSIMNFAAELGASLQLIQLVETPHNAPQAGLDNGAAVRSLLDEECGAPTNASRRVGQTQWRYKWKGIDIDFIDSSAEKFLPRGVCHECPVRMNCTEGLWALRVTATGTIQPCLLRQDLAVPCSDADNIAQSMNIALEPFLGASNCVAE